VILLYCGLLCSPKYASRHASQRSPPWNVPWNATPRDASSNARNVPWNASTRNEASWYAYGYASTRNEASRYAYGYASTWILIMLVSYTIKLLLSTALTKNLFLKGLNLSVFQGKNAPSTLLEIQGDGKNNGLLGNVREQLRISCTVWKVNSC
jgi:hypothetical protein